MCRLLLMNVALWEPLETWILLWEIPFAVCSTYTKNNMVLLNLIMMVIIIIGSTLNKQKENVEGFSNFIRGHIILRAVRLNNRCFFKLEKWLKALSLSSKVKVSFFNSCNLKSLNLSPAKFTVSFFSHQKKHKESETQFCDKYVTLRIKDLRKRKYKHLCFQPGYSLLFIESEHLQIVITLNITYIKYLIRSKTTSQSADWWVLIIQK